ncbi:MAG: hypothetical protein GY940_39855, partial [bacterium]|nr:hypothetical protein [bacterium]
LHTLEYYKHNKKLLNLKNLFTQRPGAMTFVTRTVYLNPETVVVGRSASLWGNLYIYGRLPAVAAGFFLLGIISRLIFQYLYKREHHYLFLSIKALFIFWFLKLVMSGMIYHGLKEFIAFGFLILFYKFSIAIATGGKSKKLARSF